jgi:hypothetical protein
MRHEFHCYKTWKFFFAGVVFPMGAGGITCAISFKVLIPSLPQPQKGTEDKIYITKNNISRDVASHNLIDGHQNLGEYCHTQLSKPTRSHAPVAACSSAMQADLLEIRQCHV